MRPAEAEHPLLPDVLDCQPMDDLELVTHSDAIGLRVRVNLDRAAQLSWEWSKVLWS